jgi:hypothetical protein
VVLFLNLCMRLLSPRSCYMLRPSNLPWCGRLNNICKGVPIMKLSIRSVLYLLITLFPLEPGSPSTPYSGTSSAYVLPLVWGTKFRTRIKQ